MLKENKVVVKLMVPFDSLSHDINPLPRNLEYKVESSVLDTLTLFHKLYTSYRNISPS